MSKGNKKGTTAQWHNGATGQSPFLLIAIPLRLFALCRINVEPLSRYAIN
jgi:hypothetical protein